MKRNRAVCVTTVLCLAAGLHLAGQAPAAPAFEVASIKPSPPGDPSNPLSMWIAVSDAHRQPLIGDVRAAGVFYVVTLKVSSRSRGRRQRETDVYSYLTDRDGRRFDVSPRGQEALHRAGLAGAPLTSFIDPGGAFESRLAFDVPTEATDVAYVKTSRGWFPRLLIIAEPASFLHRPTVIKLSES